MTNQKRLLYKAYELEGGEDAKRLYDEWAKSYDEELVEENDYVAPRRMAAIFAEYFNEKDARIIDIGCGTGLGGEALAEFGFTRIDGIDLSQAMLEQAMDKGCYDKLVQADMRYPTATADTAYDAVVSVGAFTHKHIGPGGIDECLRIAKSGAVLCLFVNADVYVEDDYDAKIAELTGAGSCEVLLNRIEDYINKTGTKGRALVLRKA